MNRQPPETEALKRALEEAARRVGKPAPEAALEAIRAGRKRRKQAAIVRVGGPAAGLVVVAGIVVLLAASFGFLSRGRPGSSACGDAPNTRFGEFGAIAYARGDALHVLDVTDRQDRVIVQAGVSSPIRWGPFGQWIAFQDASGTVALVPTAGGQACIALGEGIESWSWSASKPLIAGVTRSGGLVTGGPDSAAKDLLPDGWGAAGYPAFDPAGASVAVARRTSGAGWGLWVVDTVGGQTKEIFSVPAAQPGEPEVAGWSPDGKWVLFWLGIQPDALSLEAVSVEGGEAVEVVPAMLPHKDFLAVCDQELVIASGGGRTAAFEKQLAIASPLQWRAAVLMASQDPSQSEIWPSCTRDGDLVAASVAPTQSKDLDPLAVRWSLWVFRTEGSRSEQAPDPGAQFSDEAPRWSRDGRYILFVRRTVGTDRGALYLLRFGPGLEAPGPAIGPLADLGSYQDDHGYLPWSDGFDWFQAGR